MGNMATQSQTKNVAAETMLHVSQLVLRLDVMYRKLIQMDPCADCKRSRKRPLQMNVRGFAFCTFLLGDTVTRTHAVVKTETLTKLDNVTLEATDQVFIRSFIC